jgi:PIN domain nuclease of toxin-antitoxin system
VKVLFDTHAFLWAASEPERLSPKVLEFLERGGRPLVSVATFWEIVVKVQKGKLSFDAPEQAIGQAISDLAADILPVRLEHVLGVLRLEPHHKDPFDRLLVAQAAAEGAAIATVDEFVRMYPVDVFW